MDESVGRQGEIDQGAIDQGEIDVEPVIATPVRAGRTRVVTGVVAAMLVAGSGGLGFGLGRVVSDDGGSPAAAPATTDAGTVPAASSVAPDATGAPADVANTSPPAAVTTPSGVAEVVIGDGAASGPGSSTLETIWEGTGPAGERVRVQVGAPFETGAPEVEGWQPAAFCYGNVPVRLSIDGPDVVDVASGMWYSELFGSAESVLVAAVGTMDGRPMRVAVVQAGNAVVEVHATWDDGLEASAPVEGGVAVLLVDGDGGYDHQVEYELVLTDGSRETMSGFGFDRQADPTWRAACSPPPPALPDAGAPPADPDAERAAIEARFAALWDRTTDWPAKADLLDDDTGVEAAIEAVFAGELAGSAESARFAIDELVFTAPDRAWFRYTIVTDVSTFSDRYGVARLGDGAWVFPRALICQDLALAAGGCDPPVQMIFPPSWYEVNGPQCEWGPDGEPRQCVSFEESDIATW